MGKAPCSWVPIACDCNGSTRRGGGVGEMRIQDGRVPTGKAAVSASRRDGRAQRGKGVCPMGKAPVQGPRSMSWQTPGLVGAMAGVGEGWVK